MASPPIYTIGYGAREINGFIDVLRRYEIAYLLDVRSRPYSGYRPDYNREALEGSLRASGIRYVFMGDALGGRPADPTCYDAEGKVDYAQVASRAFYKDGLARVATAYEQGRRVALMCSEGKPEMCHRSKLIGRSLAEQGIAVTHIDEHNEPVAQGDVLARLTGGQPSLFGDALLPQSSRKRYTPAAEDEDE